MMLKYRSKRKQKSIDSADSNYVPETPPMSSNPYRERNISRGDSSEVSYIGEEESHRFHTSARPSISSSHQSVSYSTTLRVDERLQKVILKYEIPKKFADRLHILAKYELIIVCDDSGSMETFVDNSPRTRWDELREFVRIILEIGIIFDESGVDIYFLNREPILNVKNPETIDHAFAKSPYGYTPLVRTLKNIFQLPATRRGYDKKALVFVATDGASTDDEGNVNVDELKHLMNVERQVNTTFVKFLICTDDRNCVDYLYDWDKTMKNVDVTDDFHTERKRVHQWQGTNFQFSKGEYIVKALIGAIDQKMDDLDEKLIERF
ncbi:unnamed protein product [Adineta steineri]|uniref:VWFA domain-containing protein n=2 Tax=Adineta steineri TaxID=433720 RepID=A0A819H1Y4_9BILA|nr:unnamed protein product [Adineta steineri]